MTSISSLIAKFEQRDIHLKVDGERLVFDAPRSSLTDDDLNLLRQNKSAIIRCLQIAHETQVDYLIDGREVEEIDPATVPTCGCGLLCDVRSGGGLWICSKCSPEIRQRMERVGRFLAEIASLQSRYSVSRKEA